jgi:hypothetical protein
MVNLTEALILVLGELGIKPGSYPEEWITSDEWRFRERHERLSYEKAVSFLNRELATGDIPGTCMACGCDRAITGEEWRRGYAINFATGIMRPPFRGNPVDYPELQQMNICEKEILARLRPLLGAPGAVQAIATTKDDRDWFSAHKNAIQTALSSGPTTKEIVRNYVRKNLRGHRRKLFEDAWRETPESLKLKRGESLSNLPCKPS